VNRRAYIDTSALAKLLVEEAETQVLRTAIVDLDLYACELLETELRRLAVRLKIDQSMVSLLLEGVNLIALDRAIFADAGRYPDENLRSLDALHLVSALRLDVACMVVYDLRLAEAARKAGLTVVSPS